MELRSRIPKLEPFGGLGSMLLIVPGNNWIAPFLAELLADPYDAVRYIAYASIRKLPGYKDFDYDFMGRPKNRVAARKKAAEQWERSGSSKAHSGHDAILFDAEGRLRAEDIARLLSERDDRRVSLFE